MKTQINNENKVKFFSLYWGQNLIDCDKYSVPVELKSILVNMPSTWFESIIGQSKILLKPLSQISDEDAEFIDLRSEDYNEDGWYDKEGMFYWWAFSDVDYLRSKGYALPYLGLSIKEMAEAGWIKLTES